ncbi:MAG: hypothetical protein FWC15_04040 [Fibromonadales bacterium]|nr:hypothetical protein [Fibromonadales bacterium]
MESLLSWYFCSPSQAPRLTTFCGEPHEYTKWETESDLMVEGRKMAILG